MPKCIFHYPMQIDYNRASASHIRPQMMLQAFKDIGYDVSVVMGCAAERKRQARDVESRIRSGERFDFLYSESSTMPTQLTEPSHFPISPSIDFGLFKTCRQYGINIGLFYRDSYWLDPGYRNIGFLKSSIAIHFYRRDLEEYSRYVSVFYTPSKMLPACIEESIFPCKTQTLPPGSDIRPAAIEARLATLDRYTSLADRPLELLYVGGIGGHYGFGSLIDAIKGMRGIRVTFCVREGDLASSRFGETLRLLPNARIVHASGEELKPLYREADVALMFFDDHPYLRGSVPYKTFEYAANGLPIIASSVMAASKLITSYNAGWVIDPDSTLLKNALNEIKAKPESIA